MPNELEAIGREILTWIKASSFASVKASLSQALPDARSRQAYQTLDGTATVEDVKRKCQIGSNTLAALQQRCVSMGLMETTANGRKRRLFDLTDFGLVESPENVIANGEGNGRKTKIRYANS